MKIETLFGVSVAVLAIIAVSLFNLWIGAREDLAAVKQKLKQQVAETVECSFANASNQATIDELTGRIGDMVEERRSDEAERDRLLAERDRERAERSRLADELERERRNELSTNAECREFSALRDGNFCPTAADQLRQRSRGPGGDGDTDG